MPRKHVERDRRDRQHDEWVVNAHGHARELPKAGRKYLKELDRDLQRFMARVAGLETGGAYYDSNEDPGLLLEAEELYREALMLRVEIRDCLAAGRASNKGVVESIDESWIQLSESFDELKASLQRDRPTRTHLITRPSVQTDDLDLEELDYDLYEDDFELGSASTPDERRIHRPRGGPKR